MLLMNLEPKDIHATIDISLAEVKHIIKALDFAEVKYNGKEDPDMEAAASTLSEFYDLLAKIAKEVDR